MEFLAHLQCQALLHRLCPVQPELEWALLVQALVPLMLELVRQALRQKTSGRSS